MMNKSIRVIRLIRPFVMSFLQKPYHDIQDQGDYQRNKQAAGEREVKPEVRSFDADITRQVTQREAKPGGKENKASNYKEDDATDHEITTEGFHVRYYNSRRPVPKVECICLNKNPNNHQYPNHANTCLMKSTNTEITSKLAARQCPA